MKAVFMFLCTAFLLKHKVTYASMWPNNRYSELNVYLQGFTLGTSKENTLFACYRKCDDNINCACINFHQVNKTCQMKISTKTKHPEKVVIRQNIVYLEIRDAAGFSSNSPIQSCKWLKNLDSQAKSGVYWMKLNEPSSAPFQVFCDMTTDGGGWTLVYSYTFTQYSSFTSWSNAVTPIPNWPVGWSPSGWVPQSTTTPLSETSRSAMDFALWKKIGNDILLKPNITNWITCVEGTGSLVNWRTGTVTCRIVKVMTSTCRNVVPTHINMHPAGPALTIGWPYYLGLEGKTSTNWPTHDPCGTDTANHLKDVPSPGGVLYLR